VGTGFWNSFEDRVSKAATLQFSHNIAHTTLVGHTWDGAENVARGVLKSSHYEPSGIPVFTGLQAFKNSDVGIYFRGSTALFKDAILEGNGWSLFLAFNQVIENSLIVGEYRGNSQGIQPLTEYSGVILYDGPWELNTVDFMDFHFGDIYRPIRTIGGVGKWTNLSRRLAFSPEPKYRVFHRDFSRADKAVDEGWIDWVFVNTIRDEDGTLSGRGPGVILQKAQMIQHQGCQDSSYFFGMI